MIQYPLTEKIGEPDLLVGRAKEFGLLDKWLGRIPKRLSKSRVILARRKSGKTAIVQRIFNRLWRANGDIIPFYFNIGEKKTWYPLFALEYYRTFASQYISFIERDADLVENPLSLEKIKAYGLKHNNTRLIQDADWLSECIERGWGDSIWQTAYTAPNRFAAWFDCRILVIVDEFQNITQYIYRDEACETALDETLAGSFHDVVESKIAPMLVTGSYVGWLITIIGKYLQAGRLKRQFLNPYLTPEEGLEAVYKYAEYCNEPITNQTAVQINRLCMSDPFFISCVIQSEYGHKDLTTRQGVIDTVNYEITDESSEMSMTWGEYIELTTDKINERHAKSILLHLSKHPDRDWTPSALKKVLNLEISEQEIRKKLEIMVKADVIKKGRGDIRYQGLQDGTIYLILRHRFEEEISEFTPDLKQDFNADLDKLEKEKKALQGRLNHLVGKFAEFQLLSDFRTRQRFSLSVYFEGVVDDSVLDIIHVGMRDKFQRTDGKEFEIDVRADSSCGRTVLVEVKKTAKRTGVAVIRDFFAKAEAFKQRFPDKNVLPAVLSVGGFTRDALRFCRSNAIGAATRIAYYQEDD